MSPLRLVVVLGALGTVSSAAQLPGLYVAPNAADVVRSTGEEVTSLVYYVKESFPAPDTLAFLQHSLTKNGWVPLEGKDLSQFENSSLRSGWLEPSNDDGSPSMRLWSARWRDKRGNEVVYTLVYALPSGPRGLQPTYVGVGGLYFTKKQAARHRALMEAELVRLKKGLREKSERLAQ